MVGMGITSFLFFGPKSRSVHNSLECSDLDPNSRKDLFYQPELRLGQHLLASASMCKLMLVYVSIWQLAHASIF